MELKFAKVTQPLEESNKQALDFASFLRVAKQSLGLEVNDTSVSLPTSSVLYSGAGCYIHVAPPLNPTALVREIHTPTHISIEGENEHVSGKEFVCGHATLADSVPPPTPSLARVTKQVTIYQCTEMFRMHFYALILKTSPCGGCVVDGGREGREGGTLRFTQVRPAKSGTWRTVRLYTGSKCQGEQGEDRLIIDD